jgi:hypothetical protein
VFLLPPWKHAETQTIIIWQPQMHLACAHT